jgi:Protein of unknown function (DUF3108)
LRNVRFALLTVALAASPGAAHALAERLVAGYEIEWQGLPIGAFETEVVTEAEDYRVAYQARTTGILGWLFPFASQGSSEGTRTAAEVMPQYYEGGSRRRDESSSWAVRFGADGRAIEVEIPEEDLADREPVPPALQVAPDPLGLALGAIDVAGPAVRFSGTSFDGKRALRFELACADDLMPLADTRPGGAAAVDDETLACTVDGDLIAGASRRWQGCTMRDDDRAPAAVWLGRGIFGDAFWPVRVEAPTRYGTVTVRLVRLEPAADQGAPD